MLNHRVKNNIYLQSKKAGAKGVKNIHLNLQILSDQKLLFQTKFLVQKERKLTIQVIRHLSEIESRKLYLKRGFSSLFDYAVKELGYSEGSAYRRIKAMKLCREVPETAVKLETGSLNLTTASQLQTFFEKQNRKIKENQSDLLKNIQQQCSQMNCRAQVSDLQNKDSSVSATGYIFSEGKTKVKGVELQRSDSSPRRIVASYLEDKSRKLDLLKKAEGKSRRQTENMLCEIDPEVYQVKEKVRYLDKNQVEIKFTLDKGSYESVEQLKNLLSHKDPNISYGELFNILVKLGLDKYDPGRKLKKRAKSGGTLQIEENHSFQKDQIKGNKQSKIDYTSSSKQLVCNNSNKNLLQQKKTRTTKRYIPTNIRRFIWIRDHGECSYICPETKKKCGSKHLLQIDHIHPYSLGGSSEPSNLRLLCAGHNQYRNNLLC